METALPVQTQLRPNPRRGLRLSLLDLLLLAVLVFLGVCIGTPVCNWQLGRRWDAGLALAISLAGVGVGLLRASREPAHEGRPLVFAFLYVLLAWPAATLSMELGPMPTLLSVGLSLPGLGWALVLSRRHGFERFMFEGRAAAALVMTWGSVLAVAAWLNPPYTCRCGNESATIAACKTYAEAQEIYRRTDWDSDGVLEYAKAISGKHSLFERDAGSGNLTLVDAAFALAEGAPGFAQPKAGYVFKILKAQGPDAPGGAKTYVQNGRMTGGYALVACPAAYGGTGWNTFIISNAGTVYQKDLGPDTDAIVNAMTEFNPDAGWVVTE